MSDIGVEKVETHETVFTGRLDPEQFEALLIESLRKVVGLGAYTPGVSLSVKVTGDPQAPGLEFWLTQDHQYYRKSTPDEAGR